LLKCATGRNSRYFVEVWNAQTGEVAGSFADHIQDIWGLKFSPDGQSVVTTSTDKTTKLWHWRPGNWGNTTPIWTIPLSIMGNSDRLAFSPKGDRLLIVADNNTVKIWDTADGTLVHTLAGHTGHVIAVAYTHDGMHIVTGAGDTTIRLWDATSNPPNEIHKLRGHLGAISSLAISSDDKLLVSGSRDKTVKVWDLQKIINDVANH
jgi:WD40 repeat protein